MCTDKNKTKQKAPNTTPSTLTTPRTPGQGVCGCVGGWPVFSLCLCTWCPAGTPPASAICLLFKTCFGQGGRAHSVIWVVQTTHGGRHTYLYKEQGKHCYRCEPLKCGMGEGPAPPEGKEGWLTCPCDRLHNYVWASTCVMDIIHQQALL